MSDSQLFLIDANALCYRSFFAIRSLSTSKGQATNAVYGFVSSLKKILREYEPKYMAVCFDAAKKTFRQEKFAAYKIQRPPMPDNLVSQLPIIKEIVKAYNLAIFEQEGWEADDLMATLAKENSKKGVEVVMVTEDKDLFQLANDRVKFLSANKDTLWDHKGVQEFLGFDPAHITDFIALAGDKADNIPGVKGIGEVTARNLILQYGTLENILNRIEEIKPLSVREKLMNQKETAILCKDLAVLDTNVPVNVDLRELRVKPPQGERLFEIFRELEFKSLVEEFTPQDSSKVKIEAERMKTKDEIQSLIGRIKQKGQCAFLLEIPDQEKLFEPEGLALALSEKEIFKVDLDQIEALKEILEDPRILKITFDLKSALKAFARVYQGEIYPVFDVMIAGYLLTPASTRFDLSTIVWSHFKEPMAENQDVLMTLSPVPTAL